jgi:hypothetical protein
MVSYSFTYILAAIAAGENKFNHYLYSTIGQK